MPAGVLSISTATALVPGQPGIVKSCWGRKGWFTATAVDFYHCLVNVPIGLHATVDIWGQQHQGLDGHGLEKSHL